jgi:hypothetical protein
MLAFVFWNRLQLTNGLSTHPSLAALEKLIQRREELLMNLRDLENDFLLKKIEETDYQELRNQFLHSAGSIYKQIEDIEKKDPALREINSDISKAIKDLKNVR